MVFVFFLFESPVSGINLILTYGSLSPFGSIGIKFLASMTTIKMFIKGSMFDRKIEISLIHHHKQGCFLHN